MENAPAVQEETKKDIALVDGLFAPKTFDQMWKVACLFAKSGMMPKQYEEKPEAVMVAGQFGAQTWPATHGIGPEYRSGERESDIVGRLSKSIDPGIRISGNLCRIF